MGNFNLKIDYEKSLYSYVYDRNTSRLYLDFLNHFSSLPLGYNHPALKSYEYIKEVMRVAHTKTAMCEYDSYERDEFLNEFKAFADAENKYPFIHFSCTGALAVEAAIKTAWAHSDYKAHNILRLNNSFHGINSFGNFFTDRRMVGNRLEGIPNLLIGDQHTQQVALPYHAILSILKSDYSRSQYAAVLIEPIQCTYGDEYIGDDYGALVEIREYCTKYNIPLIFDEIQTGFGATGKVWYHQHIGIEPDIIIFGKKAQVSGIMVKEQFSKIQNDFWKLAVTFDGDLMDMIRCKYIIREIKESNLLQNISDKGELLINSLKNISALKNVRGIGGIIAFDFDTREERDSFYRKAFNNGLICNPTSEKTIRMRPNLCLDNNDIETAIEIIEKSV